MTDLADLHREHIALGSLAASLMPPEPLSAPDAERLRRSVTLFATRLSEHFAHEDPLLTALCAAPDGSAVRLAGLARRREAEALAAATREFAGHWSRPGIIEHNARSFASAWSVLHAALTRLVKREESEIYPLTATAPWQPKPVQAPPVTGIAELDDDHAEVFSLIGGLRAAVGGGRPAIDGASVATLAAYAERHFAREESLMEASAYPGLEDHRQEHHRARGILMGFRNDHLDGRHIEAATVLVFLEGWLMSHISDADMRMVEHLRASGRLPG